MPSMVLPGEAVLMFAVEATRQDAFTSSPCAVASTYALVAASWAPLGSSSEVMRWLFRLTLPVGAAIVSRRVLPAIAWVAAVPMVRIDAVPATPSLLAAATSTSVITPAAICGLVAVPARSPARWIVPSELVVAGGVEEAPPRAVTQAEPSHQ